MADNKGIPFNLLTDAEVEELFNAGTLRVEITDKPNNTIIDGGTVHEGYSVPGAVVNPPSGLGKTQFARVGMGRTPTTPDSELKLQGGINFCDEEGNPTCYPELTCGHCNRCKRRQAVHAYFGGSPSRKIMMAGANKVEPREYQIPVNNWLKGLMTGGGGFRRGEFSMMHVARPSSEPRRIPQFSNRNGIIYNLEELSAEFYNRLLGPEQLWRSYMREITLPRAYQHIKDIEIGPDGNLIATASLVNGKVNVGTIGHVDHTVRPVETSIQVENNAVVVAGKVIHKFPEPLRKHYYAMGGDYLGDSMSRGGRYGAYAVAEEYYAHVVKPLSVPKKPKREPWAQEAVDKMIVARYLDDKYDGNYPLGAMRSPALVHNAKRALKNKGLKEDGVTLADLFKGK